MPTIETKFGVGDHVWFASIATETRAHDCPDCLGAREWEATSPAGATFKFSCPRCTAQYQGNSDLNLKYQWWVPTARLLTVGQVRGYSGPDGKNEYMCHETGIGSGSVYSEDLLFAAEEEALAAAQAKANVNNADKQGWVAKQYDKTLSLSDYQLKDAVVVGAEQAARRSLRRVGYLIEDLREAETLEAVRDRLETWTEEAA
jgi:hypothetical protein